ncbi:MAG: hypothetical protein K5894_12340 [Lachnospiraceae bacterium]|nr:hypothetical protein [Lachnospiraceae bacterium]
MGTINAIRIINLNYNNNSIRVNDETMNLNGESTLISLHNGGGKSVLVQMLTAAFVHSKYRNAKDRPFESYFTTARPTIVLIEWLLDGSGNKVITGYMVRQNQENDEENQNSLDLMTIIGEYNESSIYDIKNMPVVEKNKKEIVLKSYTECKNLFENLKRDYNKKFYCYDMNYQSQARQYFDKLKEYKVDYREWEHIIKKINEKESGLSDLFADCRTETGLVDKWLLDTVEKKLDPEKEKIKNFRDIIGKYSRQYRDNESKIKQRDHIELFKENVILDDEAVSVKTLTREYADKISEREQHKGKIADFRNIMIELENSSKIREKRTSEEIEEKEAQIQDVVYEKYSFELYKAEKNIQLKLHEREQIAIESEAFKKKLNEIRKEICILECAKKYELLSDEMAAFEEKNAKIRFFHLENEDKVPRLKKLGAALYHYYKDRLKESNEQKEKNAEEIEKAGKTLSEASKTLEEVAQKLIESSGHLGELNFEINSFSNEEDNFNQEYSGKFSRNVLGLYEEGIFEIENDVTSRKIKDKRQDVNKLSAGIDELTRKRDFLSKEKIDLERERSTLEQRLIEQEEKIKILDDELQERKNIVRILQLQIEDIFDSESIKDGLYRKILETEVSIHDLTMKKRELDREIYCLGNGNPVDLPEQLVKGIEDLGIRPVYGMEWLLRNNSSVEVNRELVRTNPFLPYSIIITSAELNRLKNSSGNLYSSIPLPIILRADIEKGDFNIENKIISFDKLSFYINFDERLVDEAELKKLIEEKKEKLFEIDRKLSVRTAERENYYSQRGIIENQRLTEGIYNAALSARDMLKENLDGNSVRISDNLLNITEAEEKLVKNNESLKIVSEELDKLIRYSSALSKYGEKYRKYAEAIDERAKLNAVIEKLKNREMLANNTKNSCYTLISELRSSSHDIELRIKELTKEIALFKVYSEDQTDISIISNEELVKTGSEYDALKDKFTGEISELENDIKRIGKRIESIKKDLQKTALLNGISEDNYIDKSYDEFREDSLKLKEKEADEKLNRSIALYNECNNKLSAMEENEKNILHNMKKDTDKDKPKNINEIGGRDFDSRKNILEHQKKYLTEQLSSLSEKRLTYMSILENMEEYSDFQRLGDYKWEKDFSILNRDGLTDIMSDLRKNLNRINLEIQKNRNAVSDRINEIINLNELSEEQYHKPLLSMLKMLDAPEDILRQIDITINAFDTLMEKLMVDISIVERERDEIIAQIASYMEEINEGLSKIDSNSTINVQGKSLKMLQINVPSWAEGSGMYLLRIGDFLDDICKNVVNILNSNENPENELSSKINVNKLYDAVVGISNVSIQIYKIEKQRVYPISWNDAAKNSGGEGFLSTFVILSSLLYYIRRDENDLFADKNEGKVLLMDNPFAQTNAEHLLKPLMDIAKKNNTQLICLSGLGGESIYGRFDNIYVLNLVESKLNGNRQYLNFEHKRGAEPVNVSSAQVEVYEQMTLF